VTPRRRPLRQLANVSVSNVDKKSAEGQLPVRLINYTDVYYGDRLAPGPDLMEATATAQQLAAFRLLPGDVVITKDSETADDIGVAAYVEESANDVVLGYHLALLRPRPSMMFDRFLYWAICSDDIRGQFETSATGVTRFGLRSDAIRSASLPAPPVAAQQAIADFLDGETARIDALVAKKRRLVLALDERFMEKARRFVTGGRVLSDPLDVRDADLVGGWRAARLGRELTFGSGTTPPAGDDRFYGPGVPWIVTANLRDVDVVEVTGSVTDRALAECSLRVHPAGSLVIAMYGATVGRLGFTTAPAAVNQACCAILPDGGIDLRFLFFYLLAHRSVLLERTVGAGQPNISQQILRSIRIAVPSRSDQVRIANELLRDRRRGTEARTLLNRQIALLREHRQALITAAVTGELEIPGVAA